MKVDNIKVYDLEESIIASGYPMRINIEDARIEAYYFMDCLNHAPWEVEEDIINANKRFDVAKKLGTTEKGEGHDQFLTGIRVAFDLTFTNKAWVELERYRFIDFVSSQSTMHRISKFDLKQQFNEYVDERIIDIMEELKDRYNKTGDKEDYLKLLYSNPSGFQLTARLTTNYRALKTVYSQRKNHRLPEWREFCEWIETLPYFKELCLK